MQLKLAPERLDQRRRTRARHHSLGPLEIDGHRINDTRSVGNGPGGPFRGIAVSLTSDVPRADSSDGARADGPLPARCRSAPPGAGGPHPPAPARADGDRAAAQRLPRGARAPRSPSWSGRSPNRVSSALARVVVRRLAYGPAEACPPFFQGRNALNYFGTGLILPFEIIYLHAVRGASRRRPRGLVLATVMGTAAVVTLPSRCAPRSFQCETDPARTGNVLNAVGYGGLAFVDRPWQRLRLLGRRRRRLMRQLVGTAGGS